MQRERVETVVDVARDVVSIPDIASAGEVVDLIPEGIDWRFEPDWDGLRVSARLGPGAARLVSDRRRAFDRYFPEVVDSLATLDAGEAIVKGSLVVVGPEGLDFATVRRRLHPSPSVVPGLAESAPATLVVTDVMTRGSTDLRSMPLADRRRALEGLAGQLELPLAPTNLRRIAPGEPFMVTPQTLDRATARAWLEDRDATGRDGLIARNADGRRWLRVRRIRTATCVATGYRHAGSGVGSIRLGMYDGARLTDVGRTVAFSRAPVRRAAATALARVSPGGAVSLVGTDWVEVLPALACEVRYERLRGNRFRHAVTFVRWLPDRDPASCTIDQLRH
ncbi:MAG: ATP-dependent DNA ligase [Actinomycetota bacterium]